MARQLAFLLCAISVIAGATAQPNQCVQLGGPLLSICDAELKGVQQVYPLNSNTPITDAQVQQVLAIAKQQNLPTQRCCQQAQKFDAAGCACDASLPPVLAQVGFEVSPTGLASASKFTGAACNFTPKTC